MSREIKFRAWHKKYGYMARVADISFNRERINLNGADIGSFDDIKLMQYTGLKDKNGVEIYEGDIIISIYQKYDLNTKKLTVFFDEEDCSFSLIHKGEPYSNIQKNYIKYFEVIGNIYENPELLGGEDE